MILETSNSTKDGNFELLCTQLSTRVVVPQSEDRREQGSCREEGRPLKIQSHWENLLDSTIVRSRTRTMLNSSTSIQNTRSWALQMKWLNTYDRCKKTPKQKIRTPLDGLDTPGRATKSSLTTSTKDSTRKHGLQKILRFWNSLGDDWNKEQNATSDSWTKVEY